MVLIRNFDLSVLKKQPILRLLLSNEKQRRYARGLSSVFVTWLHTSIPSYFPVIKEYENKDNETTDSNIVKYVSDKRILLNTYVNSRRRFVPHYIRKKLELENSKLESMERYEKSVPLIVEKFKEQSHKNSECEDAVQMEDATGSHNATFPYAKFVEDMSANASVIDHTESTSLPGMEYSITSDMKERLKNYEEGHLEPISMKSKVNQLELDDSQFYEDEETEDIDQGGELRKFGTADPAVPISDVPCGGCGALLHCQDASLPGYIPCELFMSCEHPQLRNYICQRCYYLKQHKVALQVRVDPAAYPSLLAHIKDQRALVLILVDLSDMPCSIYPSIMNIVGKSQPVMVVGSKVDLLPADGPAHLSRVKACLTSVVQQTQLAHANIIHYALVSAHTGFGIEQLINKIQHYWLTKGDIYIIGSTNSGKSTLFNTLLGSDMCKSKASDLILRATASPWPGTTLNMLKFPILRPSGRRLYQRVQRLKEEELLRHQEQAVQPKYTTSAVVATLSGYYNRTFPPHSKKVTDDVFSVSTRSDNPPAPVRGINPNHRDYIDSKWCYDTPGTVQPDQFLSLLTHEELLSVMPRGLILPRTFSLVPGKSLFIAGLARLDLLYTHCVLPSTWADTQTQSVRVTVFASEKLPVTVSKTVEAATLYREYVGTSLMVVPMGGSERLARWPPLVSYNIDVVGAGLDISSVDVVLSSAGWVAITASKKAEVQLRAWTPGGRGVYVRDPPALPLAVTLRGKKYGKSCEYGPHKLYVPKY